MSYGKRIKAKLIDHIISVKAKNSFKVYSCQSMNILKTPIVYYISIIHIITFTSGLNHYSLSVNIPLTITF